MSRTNLALLLVLLVPVSQTRAQGPSQLRAPLLDRAWSAWLGCWTPVVGSGADPGTQLCIVPTADGRGVRMLSYDGDREVLAETVIADGSPLPIHESDCAGQREARWALSGGRLFSDVTLSCRGQPPLKTSGISSLVTADRWVDVQVSTSGGREQVRARLLRRSSAEPPEPLAGLLSQIPPAPQTVAAVSVDDVIEASRRVAASGVEAWLAESGARVPVDRRALVRLSDAHVAENVIDLLVAMAYPEKFQVTRARGGSPFFGGSTTDWSYLDDGYGFGLGSFGYFGGSSGYFPPGFDEPGAGGGGGSAPENGSHGQVVNGQGYTRVQPRQTDHGTVAARGGSQGASSGGAAESSGGSGGSSGSSESASGASPAGYSGGGASTGLTAVPR